MRMMLIYCMLFLLFGSLCMRADKSSQKQNGDEEKADQFAVKRKNMVIQQIAARGVKDDRVLSAMMAIPRHLFVPENIQHLAYDDYPLPIGYEQTISQPYIVAYMTEMLEIKEQDRVLEIGTGSGYQAAVLSVLAKEVFSIEIVEPLCAEADARLKKLGYQNVEVRCGNGYLGWPEKAPFDAIMLTAAPEKIPSPLIEQLAIGGRLIAPVGRYHQDLVLLRKDKDGKISKRLLIPVRFVPMTGEAEKK